jgi:hypothetical protein
MVIVKSCQEALACRIARNETRPGDKEIFLRLDTADGHEELIFLFPPQDSLDLRLQVASFRAIPRTNFGGPQ